MAGPASPLQTEVAAVIGDEAAARLAAAFCGRDVYVPRDPGPDHPVALAIGIDKARLLGEYFFATKLSFPVGPAKRQAIRALRAQGLDNREIARRLWVTDRFVRMVVAESADAEADWNAGLFGATASK